VLGLVAVLASGCLAPACPDRPPVRVQLLLLNDVYQIEDREAGGGLARATTLIRELRRQTPHTLTVLAGDTLSPSLWSSLFQGRPMIEAWNLVGLDAAAFGNHEFDFGPQVLGQRMAESRFPWLATNVLERPGGAPFAGARAWLVRDLGGMRVGMVGLTLAETAWVSNPGPHVEFAPPIPAARAAFEAMGPVDLRTGLTHLPLAEDRALAAAVPLDVILGGHDHDPISEERGPTLILKAGSDAVNVGQVQYQLGCGGAVLARRHRLMPVTAAVAPAPDVQALAARWAALADRELDVPVGVVPRPLDAREEVLRREPAPLGTYLAEVMRVRMGAHVGLLNGGAIRSNRMIPAGPVTRRDFRALLPFNNAIVLVEVTGTTLQATMERSVAALPRPAGAYLQTAGLTASVDTYRPVGQRVLRLEVGGEAVVDDGLYRVALPDYLARGGDGYTMLARGRLLVGPESGPGLAETVMEAVSGGRLP
jgi:5'-nucleotidase